MKMKTGFFQGCKIEQGEWSRYARNKSLLSYGNSEAIKILSQKAG